MDSRARDLTGQRFGRLSVIRASDMRKNRYVIWECLCDCGNTTYVRTSTLLRGTTISCGCYRHSRISVDLTGQKFGRLTVTRATTEREHSYVVWECQCDCGNTVNVASYKLKRSLVTSCGCDNRSNK